MSGVSAARNAVEALAELGSWEPEDGADINATLAVLPSVAGTLAETLIRMSDTLAEHAVEGGTTAGIYSASSTASGLRDALEDTYHLFRSEHEDELRRYEEPRPGEAVWNVGPGSYSAPRGGIQSLRDEALARGHNPRAVELASWQRQHGSRG